VAEGRGAVDVLMIGTGQSRDPAHLLTPFIR
jgi:hypothetical protein